MADGNDTKGNRHAYNYLLKGKKQMTLSQKQLNFFDTFGYLLIRQLCSRMRQRKSLKDLNGQFKIAVVARIMMVQIVPHFQGLLNITGNVCYS